MLLSIFRLHFYILSLVIRIWVTSITSPEKSAEVKFSCIQEIQRYPLWNILFFVRVVCFKGFQLPFFSTKMKYINSICDLPEKPQPPPLAFDIPRIKKKKKTRPGDQCHKTIGTALERLLQQPGCSCTLPSLPSPSPTSSLDGIPSQGRVPSLHFIEITTRSSSIQVNSRSLGKIKG